MTLQKQQQIAKSFSDAFEVFDPSIELSREEFSIFDNGVFSNSMDDKWNIFVLDDVMYCSRSWTDACIYKVRIHRHDEHVRLEKVMVTRKKSEYNSDDIEHDKILFLKLLQIYLGRDDIYQDPAYQLELIRQTLAKYQPLNNFKKSISRQSVGIHKAIYQSVQQIGEEYVEKTGWKSFYQRIVDVNDNKEILSLYVHDKKTQKGTTYHFDAEAKELIGTVVYVDL
jgi:hypothetical protein